MGFSGSIFFLFQEMKYFMNNHKKEYFVLIILNLYYYKKRIYTCTPPPFFFLRVWIQWKWDSKSLLTSLQSSQLISYWFLQKSIVKQIWNYIWQLHFISYIWNATKPADYCFEIISITCITKGLHVDILY